MASTVPGNTGDHKPGALGYYAVLAGIPAWGPTIAPVLLDWAAKCEREGSICAPAQQTQLQETPKHIKEERRGWEVTAVEVTWHNHTAEAALALGRLSRQQLRREAHPCSRETTYKWPKTREPGNGIDIFHVPQSSWVIPPPCPRSGDSWPLSHSLAPPKQPRGPAPLPPPEPLLTRPGVLRDWCHLGAFQGVPTEARGMVHPLPGAVGAWPGQVGAQVWCWAAGDLSTGSMGGGCRPG